jgi:uncharacterized RDD family membrane protein YckC
MNASLARRFGAILYDTLLVFALMFLATLPFIAIRAGEPVAAGDPIYQVTMFVVAYVFFAGFWWRVGRTLGMQSWRLSLETMDGRKPDLSSASLRFIGALISWLPAGLGFWWALWDRDNLCWHDRLSDTRLRYQPKTSNAP